VKNCSAFPDSKNGVPGVTIIEYFSALAMQALVAGPYRSANVLQVEVARGIAIASVDIAEHLILELEHRSKHERS
jgi:hypothetical protein